MEMLKVENLCKTYGTKETKVEALKNGDFVKFLDHFLGGYQN